MTETKPTTSNAAGVPAAFAPGRHDHAHCVDQALSAAEEICAGRNARLTPLRRQVLELVWRSHEPIGAYDVLAKLQRDGTSSEDGRPAAPPTVYRALDFLLKHQLVHRIESMNAYVGCPHPDSEHNGQFLICTQCGNAAEIDDPAIRRAIGEHARKIGFTIERITVEVSGLCPKCGAKSRKADGDAD